MFAYSLILSGIYSAAISIWWEKGCVMDERLFGGFRRWIAGRSDAHKMAYEFGIRLRRQWWCRLAVFVAGVAWICIGVGIILMG